MASDPLRDEPAAQSSARPRSVDGTHLAGAQPAETPAIETSEESGTLVLRSTEPPVDPLDYADRHDTRATESDELARRYRDLRKDRRRDDWHMLAMGLVGFVVMTALYLVGFIVVSRLLPQLSPWLVAKIVGLAFVAAGGGAIARSAGRIFKERAPHSRNRGLSRLRGRRRTSSASRSGTHPTRTPTRQPSTNATWRSAASRHRALALAVREADRTQREDRYRARGG